MKPSRETWPQWRGQRLERFFGRTGEDRDAGCEDSDALETKEGVVYSIDGTYGECRHDGGWFLGSKRFMNAGQAI